MWLEKIWACEQAMNYYNVGEEAYDRSDYNRGINKFFWSFVFLSLLDFFLNGLQPVQISKTGYITNDTVTNRASLLEIFQESGI